MSSEAFVGIEQAAQFLGVKVSWMYEKCRRNKVPSHKVGPFRRFRLSELDAWVQGDGNGITADLLSAEQDASEKGQKK